MPETTSGRRLVSIRYAAEAVGCNPITIRRRIAAGDLEAFRMGPRLIRVEMAAVEGLLRPIPGGHIA